MMADSAPPILTNITSTYLECTVHSAKYHCLLRLRSNRGGVGIGSKSGNQNASSAKLPAKNNTEDNNAAMMVPDISRLVAVPILANRMNSLHKSEEISIPLLPKLFSVTHTGISNGINNNDKTNDNESIIQSIKSNHPSRELIRITHDLEMQLKERLKDASDGAMTATQHTSGEEEQQLNHTPAGIQEEFLLRSEAIILELLSAVQQQIRKEQYSGGSSGRNNRKRKASGQTSTSNNNAHTSSTVSNDVPPLKYYSSLIRQLNVIQSMHNVTDISLHKDTTTSSTTPAELTSVSVTCLDEKKRSHTWHAELYPSIVLTMDMPAEFVLEDKNIRLEKWWEEDHGVGGAAAVDAVSNNNNAHAAAEVAKGALPRIQHHFDQALQRYQLLFNELDDLDSHLWILEPSLPARRTSVERRIALWVSCDVYMFVFILANLHHSIRSTLISLVFNYVRRGVQVW